MTKVLIDKKNIIPALVVFFFFCAYILLGSLIYKDYGVSADEGVDFLRGKIDYARARGGSFSDFRNSCSNTINVCYYPPLFSMILFRAAPNGDLQTIYWRRHLVTFAFFAFSVFIFFLIGKKIFKDWKIGLLGSLFLIISPRIFAHSFYNPKDIPFLSAYIIAIYTLLLLLEKKNIFTAILHGIAIGVVCSIRTPGLIMIPITIFFYLFDLFMARKNWKSYLAAGGFLFISVIIAAGLVYICTPILYRNTIQNYIQAFNIMKQYPWQGGYQLYMGQNINNQIPWHYSIVWFSISSPIFYVVLFLLGGIILIIRSLKSRTREHFQYMRDFYLVGACGILPIISVIVEKSVIYLDNRQMYFVYPALLLISLYGFKSLVDILRKKNHYWRVWTALILMIGLAYPVYFMIRYHPYEYTYFNFLAGSKMSVIKERFGLDTWGVSVKDGLEYIARSDPAQMINVEVIGIYNGGWKLLDAQDRPRLNVLTPDPPDYIIETYRYYPEKQVVGGKIVYSVKVGDTDILTVYKMSGN